MYPLAAKLSTSREARKHRIVTDRVHQHDAKVPYKLKLYIQQPIYRTLSFVVDSYADSSWRKIHLWAMEGTGGERGILLHSYCSYYQELLLNHLGTCVVATQSLIGCTFPHPITSFTGHATGAY